MSTILSALGLDRLTDSERLQLAEELWDTVDHDRVADPLTDEQRAEIERRLESYKASPDRVIPWEVIKAEALARIQQ